LEQYPINPAETAHIVPPTAGDIKASAMCIISILSENSPTKKPRRYVM
jgi:hypothetical protein